MAKIEITITKNQCRSGYSKVGDTYLVDDLCPPLCHELWNAIYPYVFALQNGAVLDAGEQKAACFTGRCPDGGRVEVIGRLVEE